MTANQLRYAELRESNRHNTTTEGETKRHNVQTENIGFGTLSEQRRHNVAYEGIQSALASETARHNRESEGINWFTAANLGVLQSAQAEKTQSEVGEVQRHNIATEGIQSGQLTETGRHNLAMEDYYSGSLSETERHNKVNETQGWFSTIPEAYKDLASGTHYNVQSMTGIVNGVKSILGR